MQSTDSIQNSSFCAFPRDRKVLCSVICLVRFCSSLRVQLNIRSLQPGAPLGRQMAPPSSGLRGHQATPLQSHSTERHNLLTQMSGVPLPCQTNVWAPADLSAACTCPEAAGRGGERGLKPSPHPCLPQRAVLPSKASAFGHGALVLVEPSWEVTAEARGTAELRAA